MTSSSQPQGVLVAFEGIDGVGKSTQIKRVAAHLRARGFEVITTFEPTNGPFGQQLRRSAKEGRLSPERELELFLLDRKEHVKTLIEPGLRSGKVILTDRYYFSTVAYQGARGYSVDALRTQNEAFAPPPALLLLIDLGVGAVLHRIRRNREEGPNTFERAQLLEKSRDLFLEALEWFPGDSLRVDGNQPAARITECILEALEPHLERLSKNWI